MIVSSEGLVLSSVPYGETSVVAKIFTRSHGALAFMINGVRKSKAVIGMAHLQPGNLVEVVFYHKPNGNLHRIKELRCHPPLHGIHTNIVKMSIIQFLTELIGSTVQEELVDEDTFDFCSNFIAQLNRHTGSLGLVPTFFMVGFSSVLGIQPHLTNLVEEPGMDEFFFDRQESAQLWRSLSRSEWSGLDELKVPKAQRQELLDEAIRFYRITILNKKSLQSVRVLQQILA